MFEWIADPQAWVTLATLSLLGFQYLLACYSYLFPKLTLARRRALGPLHAYLGKAILVSGLATMAVRRRVVGWCEVCGMALLNAMVHGVAQSRVWQRGQGAVVAGKRLRAWMMLTCMQGAACRMPLKMPRKA